MDRLTAKALVSDAGAQDAEDNDAMGGWQVTGSFANGYGVSIIDHEYSYALEMAVRHPRTLCYASPITNDVLGRLTDDELRDAIKAVAALPEDTTCNHTYAWSAEVMA